MHLEDQAIYPGAELFLIQQFMDQQGIPLESWLLGTGLSPQQLQPQRLKDKELLVSLHQFDVIYRNIFRLVNEGDLGLQLGRIMNLSRWGVLACALLNSKTLGHALLTANQYRSLLRSRFLLSGQLKDDLYEINIEKQQGASFPLSQHFHYEVLLASLNCQIAELIGQPFSFNEVRLSYDKPAHHKRYEAILQCPVKFGCEHNQLLIHQNTVLANLPLANPIAKRQALQTCEQEIQRVLHAQQGNIPWQVRSLIAEGKDGHVKLDHIAQALHMSDRSLRRKLQEANTSFLILRQEYQLQQAMELLGKKEMQISQVAGLCGYKDMGSFRDGFKKLSGQTPQHYRSSL